MATQGKLSLVRNEMTQNSPDSQLSGLSASQSAHTPVRGSMCAFVAKRLFDRNLLTINNNAIT